MNQMEMSETEIIKTIDSFLNFMGMDISNITMKQRKRMLKKVIKNLQLDNYYVELCMAECSEKEKIKEFQSRMNATNMVISEVRVYLSYLSSKEKTLFKTYKKRRVL